MGFEPQPITLFNIHRPEDVAKIEARVARAAYKHGHVLGSFDATTAPIGRGQWVGARRTACGRCGAALLGLANGEIDMPERCP